MQNVVQSSTTESVGNCSVKQHEVELNSSARMPTSSKKTNTSNSVRKFNNNPARKTLAAGSPVSVSQSTQVDLHRRELESKRGKAQLMPSSSESDSDDVLSVESFFVEEEESEGGEGDDCHCPPSSGSSSAPIDTTRFLLAAAAAVQNEGRLGELQPIDPNTKARIEALFEAAGIGKLTGADKGLGDSELLSRLTSSVSCALDEAAAALTRMRAENSNIYAQEPRSLVDACSDGDVSAVRRLLDEGRSVHETTEEGESLLSLACSAGYYELAQVLLAMRANVEDRGVKGDCTPLMEAASAGNTDIVRLLLEHGADVNAQSSSGNTPLMYACAGGHEEVVKILIEAGANLEDHNENGHTPLMEAASAGHVGVAKILLHNGAGINTHSNEFKESALTLACYKGHLEMVRFLLEAGADQEHKTDEMHTALMEASMDGHVEVARLLLDSGAQVNMPADSFESPLTLAACGGHVELALLLLERGANIEEVNDEGYTPLMEAAREGHEEMVALLLNQDADINAQTEETQETALTLACCGGFIEVADLLIKTGADIELGASTPLMEAAQEGHVDLVRYLLEAGANVNAQTATGDTALTYACENGHTQVAEVLLHWGADLEHASEGGRTPLMKAARAGHLCTVQFLISKGAAVNRTTTHNDHTPLSLACAGGHLSVAELLLLKGANPFHRLKDNSTMIIEASKSGHTRIVELLLDYPSSVLVSTDAQGLVGGGLAQMGTTEDVMSTAATAIGIPRISPHVNLLPQPPLPRPEPQGAVTAPPVASQGVASVTNTSSLATAAQKVPVKKNRAGEAVSSPSDQPLPSSQPLTTAEVQQTKNAPTKEEEDEANWVPAELHHKSFFEKSRLVEELENIERELRGEKSDKGPGQASGNQSALQAQPGHSSSLSAALSHMLTEVAELNRSNPGNSVSGVVATSMPLKLEDIVKMLGELPPFDSEPNRLSPTSSQPVVSVPLPQPSQSRESVIVTNPNVVSSPVSSAAVAAASLPPSERPKVKAVSKKDSKNAKKTPQQQLETSFQQYPQMQQLQHLQQLNQHLQQQLMQQRQLKQQNQAKLAVLQQNALHNQVQLAALQRNVAQLQQLEQQVLGPAYGAALEAGQGASAAAARAEFQNCVQQILRQKQQLQQQIRQFQLQVEQQLNQPQDQQQYPLIGGASVTSFDRIDSEISTDQTATIYKSSFYSEDSKAEEVKPHNRCEKRPIDRTMTDDSSSSTGLHVTGAPVPLYAAHDATFAATAVGVQMQNTSGQLSLMNGSGPQPLSATPFQNLSMASSSLASSVFSQTQVTSGSVASPFQIPYPGSQPMLPTSVADRQMVSPHPANLGYRQQLSLQTMQTPQMESIDSCMSATLEMSAQGTIQQQPSTSVSTEKKMKSAKKSKSALSQQQQQQPQPSYAGQIIDTNAASLPQQTLDSAPIYLASSGDFLCHVGSNGFNANSLPFTLPLTHSSDLQAAGVDDGQAAATAVAVMGDHYTGYITDFMTGATGNTGAMPVSLQHQSMATAASVGLAAGIGVMPVGGASPYVSDLGDYSSLGYLSSGLTASGTVVPGVAGAVTQYGAPAAPPTPTGMTGPLPPATASGSASQLSSILDLDSETDSNHDTALTLACTGGHEELVELLLSRGADIEHRDKKGFTPLILAATAGHEKVVETLLNHGANIEAHSERTKDTALSLACSGGRYEVVELLLNRGANKEHRNVSDYTPLSLAASGGYVNIIKLLLAHGAEINSRTGSKLGISPLMLAAMNGHVAAVRTLLEMGSDISAQIETNRNTALTLACFQGRHEVVQLLLEKKANVEHRAKTGLTPLMEAASGGYVEVGRVLLEYNADVNAPPVPSSRDTALTIAADKGHVEFVNLLLSHGAQPDVKNKKGNSPLWLAANGGHLEVIELLYRAEADIDSQDNRKVSCLMAAFRKGHIKVVKWMVKRVTQFPSDQEMTRYISTVVDKDLIKKCHHCMDIIRAAKDHQAAEANKNAAILLDELDMEKIREDLKRAAAARKRERKKRKKQEKREEKKKQDGNSDDLNGQEFNGDDDKDDDDDDAQSDNDDLIGQEIVKPAIEVDKTVKESEKVTDNPLQSKSSKKKKNKSSEQKKENIKEVGELEPDSKDTALDNIPSAGATSQSILVDSAAAAAALAATSAGKSKRKEQDAEKSADKAIKTHGVKKDAQEGFTVLDTLKDLNNLPAALKSPTSLTSPKKPQKREEGWKEVVRRGPVNAREATVASAAAGSIAAKKSSSSEKVAPALAVLQSSERSKKVSVPSNAISRVIGRAGCNINAIREISGAHIEIEKQGKGQGDRSVLIKGSAESIRQAQQLIAALIKEPEKEFNELMTKFRATNAASSAAVVVPSQTKPVTVKTTSAVVTTVAASAVIQQQPKVTRAATTIIATKPAQAASSQVSASSAASAWGTSSTAAHPSPKRSISVSGTKTPPGTTQQQPQHQTKGQAVRQLFPTESSPPAPSTATVVQNSTSTTTTQASRTTPIMSAVIQPHLTGDSPGGQQSFSSRPIEVKKPIASHPPAVRPGSEASQPESSSPVQEYSPFNNLFSKAQQTMWSKEQGKLGRGMNFASAAAAGVSSLASRPPAAGSMLTSVAGLEPQHQQVDVSKAPGYRGNMSSASHHHNDMTSIEVPTSLTSSAPGTPIPSGFVRPQGNARPNPLTPPPRIGSPLPLFNPTPAPPPQPVKRDCNSPGAYSVPPPSSLAPGGPTGVRTGGHVTFPGAGAVNNTSSAENSFDGLGFPGFHGMRQPTGNLRVTGPSFPLAPGVGGPRYGAPSMPPLQSKLNPNAPDFSSRGMAPGQGFNPMFAGRMSMPSAFPGMQGQTFNTEFPPPIGTPFPSTGVQPMLGFSHGPLARVSIPPPPTQNLMNQGANNSPLMSPVTSSDSGAPITQQESYPQHPPPPGEDSQRKALRPIGTERAQQRRPPPTASNFGTSDLNLWRFGAPSGDLGGPGASYPGSLAPGLNPDWLLGPMSGLHPSFAPGGGGPGVMDENGLLFVQKQGPHHHLLQRPLEGMVERPGDLELAFSQSSNSVNGAPSGGSFHPGGFLNGLPPPVMPTMYPTGETSSETEMVNGMWMGPSGPIGQPKNKNAPIGTSSEQSLTESSMIWPKWAQ